MFVGYATYNYVAHYHDSLQNRKDNLKGQTMTQNPDAVVYHTLQHSLLLIIYL